MASTGNLVSIKLVVDRLMQNPLMKDLNYEFIVTNAMQVLRILEAPSLFVTKRERLDVKNYRALKPVDMVRVEGIARVDRDITTYLTASEDIAQDTLHQGGLRSTRADNTYSLNSKFVNLNFEKGTIDIIYKSIATDEECYPLILDNEVLIRCIESYIKYRWFDILNDMDMISDRKLNKAEADYCFNVGQSDSNLKLPSPDEMEALVNQITQLLPSRTEHSSRFEFLGAQEKLRIQGND